MTKYAISGKRDRVSVAGARELGGREKVVKTESIHQLNMCRWRQQMRVGSRVFVNRGRVRQFMNNEERERWVVKLLGRV